MGKTTFTSKDYWRAIILYGRNVATYKIALGQCLSNFAKQGKIRVSMSELAREFFFLYADRLKRGKPQLVLPNRQTRMERIVKLHTLGKLSTDKAIERVEKEAFGDVIPRFHTVDQRPIPIQFYDHYDGGLILTDELFEVFEGKRNSALINELLSRWDLLEAAFEMKRQDARLVNDIRQFYLQRGYERTDITWTRNVLHGYQSGRCFYCGEPMDQDDIHVDHVIPRQLVYQDEVWNLVLAHSFCNEQKEDQLPGVTYIEKLITRNEHFIHSNHPLKHKLIDQLGRTSEQRRKYIYRVYEDAQTVIGYTWEQIRGYNPETDAFYKQFLREFIKWT